MENVGEILCKRVNELRQRHKLTLDQLASTSGVSRSMLSQIERGQANPTLAVTFRIAQAFGMSIGELVDSPNANSLIEKVAHNDPSTLFRADDECTIRTLSPLHMERNVEFYELIIEAGKSLDSAPHFEGTRELLTVAKGQAEVTAGGKLCKLETGDSAHYRADLPHSIAAVGKKAMHAFLVVSSN